MAFLCLAASCGDDDENPPSATISDFTPEMGQAGDTITIVGRSFSANKTENAVTIGGTPASVVTSSPTRIEAIVGENAMIGNTSITVRVRNAAIVSSTKRFEVVE